MGMAMAMDAVIGIMIVVGREERGEREERKGSEI
jgi:hypothetical protein